MINYRGHNWAIHHLTVDGKIPSQIRERLLEAVIDMYLDRRAHVSVSFNGYQGTASSDGKTYFLGGFAGKRFEIKADGSSNKPDISFLVVEQVNPSLN